MFDYFMDTLYFSFAVIFLVFFLVLTQKVSYILCFGIIKFAGLLAQTDMYFT